jgi:hypothetical protein
MKKAVLREYLKARENKPVVEEKKTTKKVKKGK